MFGISNKHATTRAQAVLTQYRASRKSIFYAVHRSSDRDIYEAQLEALDKKEQNDGDNEKIILGIFLLIYLQVSVSDESVRGILGDTLRNTFSMRSSRVDEVSSGSRLAQALGDCDFTLLESETKKLSEIAFICNAPLINLNIAALASEAMQEAFLFFKSQEIVIDAKTIKFFTAEQKSWIYDDNFLCAMLDVRARANAEKIYNGTEADQAAGILTGSLAERSIVNGFLQMIENAATHLPEITAVMLCLYPDFSKMRDGLLCEKLICLVILDAIFLTLKYMKKKFNFSLILASDFFQNTLYKLFHLELYPEDKGAQYYALSKSFFNDEVVKKLLFLGVDSQSIQCLTEAMNSVEVSQSRIQFKSFIKTMVPSEKETLLLENFLSNSAWIAPEKIASTSKAREALKNYNLSRSKIKARAADRAVYEAQLEKMARQEEDGLTVTDHMIAGLFLLCVLSIQGSSEGGFFLDLWRSGLAAIFDAGFDDDATGSSLEQVLGRFEFVVPDEVEPVILSSLADACTTPYSSDKWVAFSSVSIQEIFLLMQRETIYVDGRAANFFTPIETECVYKHSYLCAMSDISARVELARIFPKSLAEEEIVRGLLKIVENATAHLSTLSDYIATVFPESFFEEDELLRVKTACFLVLSHVYFIIELKAKELNTFLPIKDFLSHMLRAFFSEKVIPGGALEQAYCLSRQFFSNVPEVLFENVSPEIVMFSLKKTFQPKTSFSLKEWTKKYDFCMTLRDKCLLENFLAGYTPIIGGGAVENSCKNILEL